MGKHTPGPWRVRPERDFDDIIALSIVDANENEIAYLDAMYYDDVDLYANAHLIAAAPETKEQRDELLEALEKLLPMARYMGWRLDGYPLPDNSSLGVAVKKAEAAIAKAKGES